MTPKAQAEALQKKCANELTAYCAGYYNDPPGPHFKASMEQIVKDNLCLAELFEVAELARMCSEYLAMTPGVNGHKEFASQIKDALAALRAKLPKEVEP